MLFCILFSGELFGSGGGGYGTWFNFDGSDNQVQDDPSRHDYNVDQWVDKFIQAAQNQAASTRTEHQLWACGSDFQYQNADHWYHNLDKLIHYVNQNGTVNAFYSTPSIYVEQKHKAGLTWEVRHDDIFPLADGAHHYWSGYFTSRPGLKRQVRQSTNTLNAARQVEIFGKVTPDEVKVTTVRPAPPVGNSFTDSLEGTIGVATHHDGMSGTEREDVSDDYEMRIAESMGEVQDGLGVGLAKLVGVSPTTPLGHCNCVEGGSCLNMSVCSFTSDKSLDSFTVVAWNPLGQDTNTTIRVPVVGDAWEVKNVASGATVTAQAIALDNRTLELPLLYINYFGLTKAQEAKEIAARTNPATHDLYFVAEVPAVGYSTFTVAKSTTANNNRQLSLTSKAKHSHSLQHEHADTVVENSRFSLTFDATTKELKSVTDKSTDTTIELTVTWGWYNSSVGGCTAGSEKPACDGQKSGAYIFRPNSSTVFYPGPEVPIQLEVNKGALVTEVKQTFSDWATHVIRLTEGQGHIEVEWTAGPIPEDTPWIDAVAHDELGNALPNLWGKEVIVKYATNVISNGKFYTDANGREMVPRAYNQRGPSYPTLSVNEPVAGNYYPVNNIIAIEDDTNDLAFSVLTDVSQGGASLANGEIELMVHRRVLDDDSRGVQEPLNETMCVTSIVHCVLNHSFTRVGFVCS